MKAINSDVMAIVEKNTVILRTHNREVQRKECPTNEDACSYVRMMVMNLYTHGVNVEIFGDYTSLFASQSN